MSPAEYQTKLRRELARAEKASAKASGARAALPAGSSRARVTSANARWARAAEYRDDVSRRLAASEAAGPCDHPANDDHVHACAGCGAIYRRAPR